MKTGQNIIEVLLSKLNNCIWRMQQKIRSIDKHLPSQIISQKLMRCGLIRDICSVQIKKVTKDFPDEKPETTVPFQVEMKENKKIVSRVPTLS